MKFNKEKAPAVFLENQNSRKALLVITPISKIYQEIKNNYTVLEESKGWWWRMKIKIDSTSVLVLRISPGSTIKDCLETFNFKEVKKVIFIGFCGALNQNLKIGKIVIPAIVFLKNFRIKTSLPLKKKYKIAITSRIILKPYVLSKFRKRGIDLLDMETYFLYHWGKEKNIPTIIRKDAIYFFISVGGVEVNMAINSALLGIPSVIVGSVGNDYLLSALERYSREIIPRLSLNLEKTDDSSGIIIVIRIENKTKKIKLVNYGASENLEWNEGLRRELNSCTMFFSSLFTPNTPKMEKVWRQALKKAEELKKRIIITMGGINTISVKKRKKILKTVGEMANIISMNENEYRMCGVQNESQLKMLFPASEIIIITKGSKGATLYSRNEKIELESIVANPDLPIFEVGSGDAFLAALIYGISSDYNLVKAGQFASAIASFKVRYPSSHLPVDTLGLTGMIAK